MLMLAAYPYLLAIFTFWIVALVILVLVLCWSKWAQEAKDEARALFAPEDEAKHWRPNAPSLRSFNRRRELRGASLEYPERKAR